MKPITNRDPFKIGLAMLAAFVALGVGIVLLSVASFGAQSYTAVLEHTAGLRTGEDVQVHGVSLGKVTDIELRERDVLVTFNLKDDLQLGSESSAEVKVATLLGTHFLQVEPEGDGELADGQIPIDRTSVPYNLQDVIEKGTAKLDELDPVLLANALSEVSKTLRSSGDDVAPALEGVGRLSELVSTRSEQTGELLRAARDVTDQLDNSKDDLIGLMESTNLVSEEITSRRAAITKLFRETSTLSLALREVVAQTDADIGPTLRDLDRALDALNREDESLRKALGVMAPAFRYIANATGNGPYGDLYVVAPGIPADDGLCKLGSCP